MNNFKLNDNDRPFDESFRNPSALYRGAPFWSWNGSLEEEELFRQIDVFLEMGIGGFHIHCRTGLELPYLGEEFLERVRKCRDYARSKGMLTWLYDEDRWPSGYGGGKVTVNKEYRSRHLLFTKNPYGEGKGRKSNTASAHGGREENGVLLAKYAIRIKDRCLASFRVLKENESVDAGESLWYAYQETARPSEWFNNQTYVDTLNPEAILCFIACTHEVYREAVGESFGREIPAIFTDEPQFVRKDNLPFSDSERDALFPWTPGVVDAFEEQHGASILDHLPELVWDLPNDRSSIWRYRYTEWIAERFAASFADQLGQWCQSNGIALSGHMMEEPTLRRQSKALGEAMRSYRSFQIPGIDMLCDNMELNTAKQAQSAARQFGRPGVMSELYGVTGWHFNFAGHKRQGDWQAALGVLFRVHHLTWYCMRGEAKRDYPASIGYQSPWYREYPVIEDHFARLGAALSRGESVCKIGMIHPIESYWLCDGPMDTSHAHRKKMEDRFTQLTKWLLFGGLDFDFIAESLLPAQSGSATEAGFGVGAMTYDVVLVPGLRTVRASTLERLEDFAERGGEVIFIGEVPSLVDAEESSRALELAEKSTVVSCEEISLIESLEKYRTVEFRRKDGELPAHLLYQLRQEDEHQILFVCNTNQAEGFDGNEEVTFRLKGHWKVSEWDTATGNSYPVEASSGESHTCFELNLDAAGHALLRLSPGQAIGGKSLARKEWVETGRLAGPVPVSLDEPNVLLFDTAEYAINEGEWQAEIPLLEIENVLREKIGLSPKTGQIAQPWVDRSPVEVLSNIRLRVCFSSKVAVCSSRLALENVEESDVFFNGEKLAKIPSGYFTDRSIEAIELPPFSAGEHSIEIALSFTRETSIEWFYLLGDFGVELHGARGIVTERVAELPFGDWTAHGLPFYGGNVTYHCQAPCAGTALQFSGFDGTAIRIESNNDTEIVYRAPFIAQIPFSASASIDITLFGHRANCFGPVHNASTAPSSGATLGPKAWRTTGLLYSNEYRLKPLGIWSAPLVVMACGEELK